MGGVRNISHKSNRTKLSLFSEFFYCYFRYGCLPRQFLLSDYWNRSENDRRDILTYRRFVKIMNELNEKSDIHILENKAHFNEFFSDFVDREWILSTDCTPHQIKQFIQKHGCVIVKPFNAMEGHGIYKIDTSDIDDLDSEAKKLSTQPFMIEEILKQHPAMVFGNTSVNTIRVHTIVDNKGKGHVLSCVLRVGIGDTVVDNYCSGGVIYPVDVNSGIITGKGKSHAGDGNTVHPGTNIVMLGYKIPNWDIVLDKSIDAAERLPKIRLIGWDVAITNKGIALIEGNHNPDYELYEFIGEGKTYPIIKQFM